MGRPLRGERYAEDPRASPGLPDFLVNRLPYLSMSEAMDFYAQFSQHMSPADEALLGCNDRFYLLAALLNRPDIIHPWLYDRCREVEQDPDGHLDLWARYHYKSTIITFAGCIQEVLSDPEITIGIFSNNKGISRPFLSQIKDELEANEELKRLYPDVLWMNPRKEAPSWSLEGGITVKRKGNPKEATIEAHGLIDGLPTGRHFRLLVYDDVIDVRNVTNPQQIKKATERVEISDNLGVGELTRKWFVGTRYHFGDSYAHLIQHEVVQPRIYPATVDGTLNGEPVFLSPAAWEKAKKAQRSTISAQMLQNPLAGEENIFKTKWLQPYWIRPYQLNVYIMGDPSKGKSATSDRTAIAVIGIDPNGNKFLLDGYCHRMPLSERWRRLKELYRKWYNQPGVMSVEVGYERYGAQVDDEYFQEQMRLEGQHFSIKELNWTGDAGNESKEKRVERLEPDFRNGNFYVPAKVWTPAVEGFVARWYLEEGSDEIKYAPIQGLHRYESRALARGERYRVFEPLRRIDEDGNIYDLVRVFFEEYAFFPFSPRDDLIDAMSRIYDMNPQPARRHEQVPQEDYVD